MTINKFNYEVHALDYLEGNLSPEMTAAMERFLKTHPAIEAELSGMMDLLILEPDTSIVFEPKEDLLKPENIHWLSKKWVRPLIAAASIALLIGTFFLGYQTGMKEQPTIVVAVESPTTENQEEIVVKKEEKKEGNVITNPIRETLQEAQTPIKKTTIIAQNEPPKNQLFSPKVTKKKPQLIAESAKEILPIEEATIVEVAENEPTTVIKTENDNPPIVPKIRPIVFLNIQLVAVNSETDSLDNLNNALTSTLPIDEQLLIKPRRKRNIKQFLGRFPIQNLKEAIIPSYYKEEGVTGQ